MRLLSELALERGQWMLGEKTPQTRRSRSRTNSRSPSIEIAFVVAKLKEVVSKDDPGLLLNLLLLRVGETRIIL
jgi:hypothetical protein